MFLIEYTGKLVLLIMESLGRGITGPGTMLRLFSILLETMSRFFTWVKGFEVGEASGGLQGT